MSAAVHAQGGVAAVAKSRAEPDGFALRRQPDREPGPSEVLVEVHAGGLCGTDLEIWQWPGWLSDRMAPLLPVTIGHEFAGHVRAVGAGVEGLAVGDFVAVESHISCGECRTCTSGRWHICERLTYVGVDIDGGLARHAVLPEIVLRPLPDTVEPDSAAMLEPFGLAVRSVLCDGGVEGRSVLVTGLGPLGLMTMAAAGVSGATEVIGLESNPDRLAWAHGYAEQTGAGTVLDATADGLEARVRGLTDGRGVDVWVDFSGAEAAIAFGINQLVMGGSARLLGTSFDRVPFDLSPAVMKEISFHTVHGRDDASWSAAIDLLAERRVDLSGLVSHRLPLERFAEAFELLLAGKACKVLLSVAG